MIRRSLIYLSTKLKNQINSGYINGVKFLLKRYPKNRLALTNSANQKDGYGAQIQRILSVVAVSNEFNIKFILRPITFAEDQITQTPLLEFERIRELTELNNWLRVQLNPWLAKQESNMKVRKASNSSGLFFYLLLNFFTSRFLSKGVLLEIENFYQFTSLDPDMYTRLQSQMPLTVKLDKPTRVREIHVHLRYINFAIGTERYLDPNYYLIALKDITSNLVRQGLDYKIFIHSDFSDTANNIETSKHHISMDTITYLNHLNLLNEDQTPNKNVLNLARTTQSFLLQSFDNTSICQDEDLLMALTKMTQADYLVLSKSSFAFITGIFNIAGRIYTPEYWNNAPSNWVKLHDIDYIL
jgi:hypothetical protein